MVARIFASGAGYGSVQLGLAHGSFLSQMSVQENETSLAGWQRLVGNVG